MKRLKNIGIIALTLSPLSSMSLIASDEGFDLGSFFATLLVRGLLSDALSDKPGDPLAGLERFAVDASEVQRQAAAIAQADAETPHKVAELKDALYELSQEHVHAVDESNITQEFAYAYMSHVIAKISPDLGERLPLPTEIEGKPMTVQDLKDVLLGTYIFLIFQDEIKEGALPRPSGFNAVNASYHYYKTNRAELEKSLAEVVLVSDEKYEAFLVDIEKLLSQG